MIPHNLLADLPAAAAEEVVAELVRAPGLRIERIVSTGQASPPGFWYDQPEAEWVAVLAGAAGLHFADETAPRRLGPGDHVLIPARRRHRVAWTDSPTIWLAVHFSDCGAPPRALTP
ncbi:cupin domain-containing protein [Methylobacterium trifolii]|nr:cupin domain-containing protein [Methylobacterium trifolii]